MPKLEIQTDGRERGKGGGSHGTGGTVDDRHSTAKGANPV